MLEHQVQDGGIFLIVCFHTMALPRDQTKNFHLQLLSGPPKRCQVDMKSTTDCIHSPRHTNIWSLTVVLGDCEGLAGIQTVKNVNLLTVSSLVLTQRTVVDLMSERCQNFVAVRTVLGSSGCGPYRFCSRTQTCIFF